MEEILIKNLKEFRKWMSDWVLGLKEKHLLLLFGPIGVGKTQFVRFLVEALEEQKGEMRESVFSPSFTIHNQYKVGQIPISHVDLYRLKVEEELYSIGFSDLFRCKCGIVIVEWSEHLNESFLPLNWTVTKIRMEFVEENPYQKLSEENEQASYDSVLKNSPIEKRKLFIQSIF